MVLTPIEIYVLVVAVFTGCLGVKWSTRTTADFFCKLSLLALLLFSILWLVRGVGV